MNCLARKFSPLEFTILAFEVFFNFKTRGLFQKVNKNKRQKSRAGPWRRNVEDNSKE